ncbi:transposase [Alteromonas gilva]|uniref:Transposase n=1 Tax=Alteromonas gilva TaxID=2987522 RepID=A0ABT5L290_9ALTE|nr:transposase [Alteromonas gilva]MDC8829972.1 transposase [Alteromonas gilva]
MPKTRSSQISLTDTPFYHCISRCVRRSYLCGKDKYTGKSFEHRKSWVEERLLKLAGVFAIDVCAYAVMSNHVHVVLHVNTAKAREWSVRRVLIQWHKLHKGTLLTRKYLARESLNDAEMMSVEATAEIYRQRLFDISWFMRNLNEYIARAANAEDECTGRFWEGRFKSQALLDEKAVLTCMVYVDLNPIRAKVAHAVDESKHTSIFRRLKARQSGFSQPPDLMAFYDNGVTFNKDALPFNLTDYCQLVTNTALMIQQTKAHDQKVIGLPILNLLGLSNGGWLLLTTEIEKRFCYVVGASNAMARFKRHKNLKRIRGISQAKKLFESA